MGLAGWNGGRHKVGDTVCEHLGPLSEAVVSEPSAVANQCTRTRE